MALIVELNHQDYPTHNVCRGVDDVEYFLQKEKRFSLDEFKRRIGCKHLLDLLQDYQYAKLYEKGNCIGGIYPAETLLSVECRKKEQERIDMIVCKA